MSTSLCPKKSLFVEVRSTIGAAQSPTYLSTGLGLKEIQKEMKLHDGEFTWGSQGNEWFSHWTIPRKEKSRGAHKSEKSIVYNASPSVPATHR